MRFRRGPGTGVADRAKVRAGYLGEQMLGFAAGALELDQKEGIARYGPATLGESRHPSEIRLGFVGSGESVASARDWFERAARGLQGEIIVNRRTKKPQKRLQDFPGSMPDRGFFSSIVAADHLVDIISVHDLDALKKVRNPEKRFDEAVALIGERVKHLNQQDDQPTVVILALPNEFLPLASKAKYYDGPRGLVYRDFRRAIKAEVMRHKVVTQILLQPVSEAEEGARNVDPASKVAWNLFTSLYFKAGGVPWRPLGLRPDTCYIGISFHRPLGDANPLMRSSVAQAFDEDGTGLVLRGPDFTWDEERDGKSAHLSAEASKALLELVLKRYKRETGRMPGRVVVHKTSRFVPAEREGMKDALQSVSQFDLIAVTPTDEIRLVRTGQYPPLRGTLFSVGTMEYVYTTGYIKSLKAYPHGHVPRALQIADHHGDSDLPSIAKELLILTRMNWNSAGFAGTFPITIRFSKQVGDIMREIPRDREPEPQFKYYT
jgi:hypothetical protein